MKTASSKLMKQSNFNLQPSANTLQTAQPSPVRRAPAPTGNILHQSSSPSNLLKLLQALRSRVQNLIPAPPTALPVYLANSHVHNNNLHQPQSPLQFNFQGKVAIPQPTAVIPTQATSLQIYQTPTILLQAPVPPKRPIPPIPPQQPPPLMKQPPPMLQQQHQSPHYYQPSPPQQQQQQQLSPQNRPPPVQRDPPRQGAPALQKPQHNQRPPPQRTPLAQRSPGQPRSNYYNSYRYQPMVGSDCSGFPLAGQLCCDGILNIPPKTANSNRRFVCCSKTIFDPNTHVCCGDHPVPKPAKGPPQMCCGHMLYNPRTQICCDKFPMPNQGGTIKCCKKRTYNPATQMCCGENIKPRLPEHKDKDCCGKHMYNPATHLCCDEGNTFLKRPGVNCCGKNMYTPTFEMCCFGDALPKGSFCSAK